jgi:hypothetical protein
MTDQNCESDPKSAKKFSNSEHDYDPWLNLEIEELGEDNQKNPEVDSGFESHHCISKDLDHSKISHQNKASSGNSSASRTRKNSYKYKAPFSANLWLGLALQCVVALILIKNGLISSWFFSSRNTLAIQRGFEIASVKILKDIKQEFGRDSSKNLLHNGINSIDENDTGKTVRKTVGGLMHTERLLSYARISQGILLLVALFGLVCRYRWAFIVSLVLLTFNLCDVASSGKLSFFNLALPLLAGGVLFVNKEVFD